MKIILLLGITAILHNCSGAPDDKEEVVISSREEALESTKMTDVKNIKHKKKGKLVRRRVARTNLKDLSKIVSSAPVIEGVRMSDDDSDKVDHRDGRFINNVFIGDEDKIEIPPEYTVTAAFGDTEEPKSLKGKIKLRRKGRSRFSSSSRQNNPSHGRKIPVQFEFSDFSKGRQQDIRDTMAMESRKEEVYAEPRSSSTPVYFISEDPDSLHADRSPYSFEPADTHSAHQQQAAVIAASNEDFVIKEHTYQMCPGCPSFSIPIPVPKSSFSSDNQVINPYNSDPGYEFQHNKEETIMDKIMAVVQPAIDTAKQTVQGFFNSAVDSNEITEKGFSDRLSSVEVAENPDISPLMYAGMAAMGLGVATLLSSGLQVMSMQAVSVGRQFNTIDSFETENSDDNDALEYDINDILCIPRNYCETMKRKKYMLDQYPTIKKIASFLVEIVFDKDSVTERGETSVYNQCYLRECVFALLK